MSSSEILESRSYHAGEVCFSPAYQKRYAEAEKFSSVEVSG